MTEAKAFQRPSRIEALFNRLMGKLVAIGLGPGYMRVLDVRGRKSGRLFSTPVNLLELDGAQYLVAPRGNTQWVRNARAAGRVGLRRGSSSSSYRVEEIPLQESPDVLKAYLSAYVREVQRYFSVEDGADREAFVAVGGSRAPRVQAACYRRNCLAVRVRRLGRTLSRPRCRLRGSGIEPELAETRRGAPADAMSVDDAWPEQRYDGTYARSVPREW